MGLRRRVEITIQRRELTIAHSSAQAVTERCAVCDCEVSMLPIEMAAKAAVVSPRTLYRWVEQNKVHFRELSDGRIMVCANSLPRR